jgi:hypothetical protein
VELALGIGLFFVHYLLSLFIYLLMMGIMMKKKKQQESMIASSSLELALGIARPRRGVEAAVVHNGLLPPTLRAHDAESRQQ